MTDAHKDTDLSPATSLLGLSKRDPGEPFNVFLGSLAREDNALFAECPSASQLVEYLRRLQSFSNHRLGTSGTRLLRNIEYLGDRLQPFFDIGNVLVQNSCYASFIWGALRFVLLLAEKYVTFFDKFATMLSRLCDALQQLQAIGGTFRNSQQRLLETKIPEHVGRMYDELLQIFQAAAEVFIRPNGKRKRSAWIFFDVAWSPFNLRFDSSLKRLKHLQDMIQQDLMLASIRGVLELQEALLSSKISDAAEARSERDAIEPRKQAQLIELNELDEVKKKIEANRPTPVKVLDDGKEIMLESAKQFDGHLLKLSHQSVLLLDAIKQLSSAPERAEEKIWQTKRQLREQQAKYDEAKMNEQLGQQASAKLQDGYIGIEPPQCTVTELKSEKTWTDLWNWLSPPNYGEVLRQSQHEHLEGTNAWIFQRPEFIQWVGGSWVSSPAPAISQIQDKCLWLHGTPGCGKTIMSSSIIDHLRDNASVHQQQVYIIYYFFKSTDTTQNNSASAWRALLCQILEQTEHDSRIIDVFLLAMSQSETKRLPASSPELQDLLHLCLTHLDRVYIICDGLDECLDVDNFTIQLKTLATGTASKWLFTSRPNVDALHTGIYSKIAMDKLSIQEDLKTFAMHQVVALNKHSLLPGNVNTDDLVARLVTGADGMILWIVLMSAYLRSPAMTPLRRLRILKEVNLPEGLDKMYDRIIELIQRSGGLQLSLARKILLWLCYAQRDLSSAELEAAVTFSGERSEHTDEDRFADFARTAVLVCAGLVMVDLISPRSGSRSVRLVHLSVKEYFEVTETMRNETCDLHTLGLCPFQAHCEITEQCLQHMMALCREAPPRPGSYSQTAIKSEKSYIGYTSSHWMEHLSQITLVKQSTAFSLDRVCSVILAFLSRPLAVTSWIELVYRNHTLESSSTPILDLMPLKTFQTWLNSLTASCLSPSILATAQILHGFHSEISMFLDTWDLNLTVDPMIAWDEGALLNPPSFLYKHPQGKYSLSSSVEGPNLSSKPLCTVSETTSDGRYTFVVTVWPSARYEEYWRELDPWKSYKTIEDHCKNWIVRIETWSTEAIPKKIYSLSIPLDSDEVALQMRQSLRDIEEASAKTSFPISVSPDGHTIVVLRTVYAFQIEPGTDRVGWKSAVLRMDYREGLRSKWDDNTEAFDPNADRFNMIHRTARFWQRKPYTYRVTLSHDGHFLFLVDREDSYWTSMAVFGLWSSADDLQPLIISYHMLESGLTGPEHPTFHSDGFLSLFLKGGIYLWDFLRGKKHTKSLDRICMIFSNAEWLGFSSCGKFIVVTSGSSPIVVPIPDCYLLRPDVHQRKAPQTDQSRVQALTLQRVADSVASLAVLDAPVSSMQTKGTARLHSQRLVSTNATNVHIEESVDLFRLPRSIIGSNITTSMVPKRSMDPEIRVFLNQQSRDDYRFDASEPQLCPTIVDRRIADLRRVITTNNAGQALLLQENSEATGVRMSLEPEFG